MKSKQSGVSRRNAIQSALGIAATSTLLLSKASYAAAPEPFREYGKVKITKRDPGRPDKGPANAFLADVYLTMAGWYIEGNIVTSSISLPQVRMRYKPITKANYWFRLPYTDTSINPNLN
ncbi:hypothetical protein ON006_09610 [Dyadobacter pollutisoli]|jgi:hypothetical protein|uniref:Uncharacterized protein n=1 Tax=Dyadobacter pollutisoli TaxID=2910158 RepID=A0A9E8NDX3_9BACT|nr:hypothetical protein [Dyadobacter pollutisoli]WAC14198.1 hypothetical protein ON006_09610 [Dyadobacter pollutisoli]